MLQSGCDHAALLLRPFLLYVALHFIGTPAAAQTPIKLDPSTDKYPISCCVEFLEDPSNALTFNDVSSSSYNDKFKKSTGSLNFGYSSSSYWMRFQIQNLDALPP